MQTRGDKEIELKFLGDCFDKTQVAMCVDYRGLTVIEITNLRKDLRKSGSLARVSKNTLAKLAVEKAYKDANPEELKKFMALFEGMSMLVFSTKDPVTPARVLAEFAKKNEKIKVRGGFLDGAFVSEAGVKELATMPSKEEGQAKLLALLSAPATKLVQMLQAPAAALVRVLEARRKQLEEQGAK